jgi:hypothetical protein
VYSRFGQCRRACRLAPWPRACALTIGLLCGLPAAGAAQVAPQPGAAAPVPSSTRLEVGGDERFRFEAWDNITDHSDAARDQRTQWRFRTRLWATGRLGDHVAFGVGLTNESKGQGEPKAPLTLDETIFDALWMDITPHPRVSVRVGRQNILRGEGLVLHDGTPGDGPRTDYVNGIDATVRVASRATFEVILASDPSYDTYLPVIHDQHRRLVEWQERLAGVYYTDTRKPGLDVQAYYFLKREHQDTRPPTDPQFQPDRSLSTVGVRVVRDVRPAWALFGEAAAQVGEQVPRTPIRAWAGSIGAQRRLSARWTPTVRASYTALSGDSPSTTTIGHWDPVVGRWPMWSELMVQALGPEVGPAYWTNMGLWRAEVTLKPSRQTGARATYYHLSAFHPFPGPSAIFGSGTHRGDLLEARFDFTPAPALKGYVLYEGLLPGSFYAGHAPGYLLRVEFTAAFQHRWR